MRKYSLRAILMLSAILCGSEFVSAQEDCETRFETVNQSTQLTPVHKTYEIIPGRYDWVEGEISGASLEYEVVPPTFEMVTEISTGDGTEVAAPLKRVVVREPSYPIASFKPYEVKDGRTRVQVARPQWREVTIPAQTQSLSASRKSPCLKTASELKAQE